MNIFTQIRPLLGVLILLGAVIAFALLDRAGAPVPDGERNLAYGAVLTALIYEGSGAMSIVRRPSARPASGGTDPYDQGDLIGGGPPASGVNNNARPGG